MYPGGGGPDFPGFDPAMRGIDGYVLALEIEASKRGTVILISLVCLAGSS